MHGGEPTGFRNLWSGLLPMREAPYAANGVIQGSIPHRRPRGCCLVRCTGPSLWPFAARALGFTVMAVDSDDTEYLGHLRRFFLSFQRWPDSVDRSSIRIVFCDSAEAAVASAGELEVPHVFETGADVEVAPPVGWVTVERPFSHAQLGGATAGCFNLGVLLPSFLAVDGGAEVPGVPVLSATPLINMVESTVSAATCTDAADLAAVRRVTAPSGVLVLSSGCLNPLGLLPVRNPHRLKVVVPCVFSRTQWGVRSLEEFEIGGAYDIPILMSDSLRGDENGGKPIFAALRSHHPGKVLHLGSDFLLSQYCRGGWFGDDSGVMDEEEGQGTSDDRIARILASAKISGGQQLGDGYSWVKVDGQKEDDAEVPVRNWDEMWMDGREDAGVGPVESWWAGRPLEVEPTTGMERWRWALEKIRSHDDWLIRRWRRNAMRTMGRFVARHRGVKKLGVHWAKAKQRYEWTGNGNRGGQARWREEHSTRAHRKVRVITESAREALGRVLGASWWDWDAGSSLFFWAWPESHVRWAMEGQPHFIIGDLPRFKEPQRRASTKENQLKVNKKVNKVRYRLYIMAGIVYSLTHMFDVPKGLEDIRMVYDGTKSGLNDVLFAPHFSLPILYNCLRSLLPMYYAADLDVGEMFLNWWLHEELRGYAGVDVSHVQNRDPSTQPDWERGRNKRWERWERNFMGLKDSPYRSLQLMIKAKFIAYGDRKDRRNPFHWEWVVLNLPGSEDYNPALPWVMKVRWDYHLACEVYIYVDDCKFTGWSKVECWKAAQRFSRVLTSLGIQDAYRKRTVPSPAPGPWAGGVLHTTDGVVATVTKQKWEKTQGIVRGIAAMMEEDCQALSRKELEKGRGFLIYVGRTYRWIGPYLKGLHNTIDGFRWDRDEEGYRLGEKQRRSLAQELAMKKAEEAFNRGEELDLDGFAVGGMEEEDIPDTVAAVPRLRDDINALLELTEGEEPAVQTCRAVGALTAVYLVGDASGRGFGSALWDEEVVVYNAGNWRMDLSEESSNWREANNLTTRIEELADEGRLDGQELFVFTDNLVFEGTFFKGYSSSKKLTEIILRLRMVERRTGCILHVIHIAGTRMKKIGADQLSRSDLMEGLMAGENPWSFIPLNEDADSRTDGRVSQWIRLCWEDSDGRPLFLNSQLQGCDEIWESSQLIKLEPTDWFRLHEIPGHRLWIPPPAAMETVMELFADDHLVNPHLAHVFVVPRLMTHLWRKHLFKDSDLSFYVHRGAPFWPLNMHEPLTVVIILPLGHTPHHRGPWTVRGRAETGAFARRLETEFQRPGRNGRREFLDLEEAMPCLQEETYQWTWAVLREFLYEQRNFPPVQSGVLRGVLPGLRGLSLSSPDDTRRRGRRGRKRVRSG